MAEEPPRGSYAIKYVCMYVYCIVEFVGSIQISLKVHI